MPNPTTILYEKDPATHIAELTLNRPERLNAYNLPMMNDLLKALEDFRRDETARVLVLTGAGRAFCAGADVSGEPGTRLRDAIQDHGPLSTVTHMQETVHHLTKALWWLDKPVVAGINGAAVMTAP